MSHLHSLFFYEPSQTWCCGECGQSGIEPTAAGMLKRAIALIEDEWEGTSENTEGMKWLRDARSAVDYRPDPMMADLMAKANDPRYSDEWIGNAFRAAFSLLGPEYAADPQPAAPPLDEAPGVA